MLCSGKRVLPPTQSIALQNWPPTLLRKLLELLAPSMAGGALRFVNREHQRHQQDAEAAGGVDRELKAAARRAVWGKIASVARRAA